jgi:hypothetical protein
MFNIQNSNSSNVFVFNAMHGTNQNAWQAWTVPKNAKMLDILAIGSGGGGGRPSGGVTNGGGGGSCSGLAKLLIPAIFLPSVLYILVPAGGRGSTTSNTGGSSGYPSMVATTPSTNTGFAPIIASGGTAGNPGGGGSTASGTPGATAHPFISGLGLFSQVTGIAGTSPGTGGAGTSTTTLNNHVLTPGTGAGGRDVGNTVGFPGGSITSSLFGFTSTVTGGSASNRTGESGYRLPFPFGATGGAGATGNINDGVGGSPGGRGGNGNIGCGGGGGGTGNPSGNGGNGGDGIVIITVWS